MMHYRVQIRSAEDPFHTSLRREIPLRKRFLRAREKRETTVSIFDRLGREVATFHFDTIADAGAHHNVIVDDLIRLDVEAFREKYGLHAPPT